MQERVNLEIKKEKMKKRGCLGVRLLQLSISQAE
jgi:hypothetical protein